MKKIVTILLACSFFVSSCIRYLNKEAQNWNPYKPGEVLIFTSSRNEIDTIFILEVEEELHPMKHGTELPSIAFNQNIQVRVKHTDPNNNRYLINNFLEIEAKTFDNPAEIRFLLAAKNSWFYDWQWELEKLEKQKFIRIAVPFGEFNDVLEIEDQKGKYSDRDNFVKKVYWSKSIGYLRWDKKDGTIWELKEKYVP